MKTTHRDYSEENGDFHRLVRYFTAGPLPRRTHSTWCLGRLVDWKYALYERKRAYASFCNENAHLWFDAFGELAGFAVLEGGTSEFQILTLPGYRLLYPEMLEWVLEAGRERPAQYGCGFSTEVTEFQQWEIGALERCGFQREDEFFTRRFDLTGELAPRIPLPPGFEMVDLHTCPDYRAQARLRANAFQKKADLSEAEMEERLQFYNRNQNSPIYHAPTDLCVRAADGRFASGCEALINAPGLEADIERVCTHSDFRQRGFARAVILECLHRLKDLGLANAYITGYSPAAVGLYGSLGAADEVRAYCYEMKS